jgi:hypothetical protein
MYQTVLKGCKLVIDTHPFLGKKDVCWCYFLWSFFDKSLLGYPHIYAFQGAKTVDGVDPFDCTMLARKVASSTETTIREVFQDDIKTERITLDPGMMDAYQELKERLFNEDIRPWLIVRKLKKFVNDQIPHLRDGLDLLSQGRVHEQYKGGQRLLVVSDAKVDLFLEVEFWKYINRVNTFTRTLWESQEIE